MASAPGVAAPAHRQSTRRQPSIQRLPGKQLAGLAHLCPPSAGRGAPLAARGRPAQPAHARGLQGRLEAGGGWKQGAVVSRGRLVNKGRLAARQRSACYPPVLIHIAQLAQRPGWIQITLQAPRTAGHYAVQGDSACLRCLPRRRQAAAAPGPVPGRGRPAAAALLAGRPPLSRC